MSNTLNTVQKFFKAGKILTIIGFVCGIVGASGCILGAILLKVAGIDSEITGLVMSTEGMNFETAFVSCIAGFIICAGVIAATHFGRKYFTNELEAGTPFTFEGAQEIRRLGIITIAVPLGTEILASIVYEIMAAVMEGVGERMVSSDAPVVLGIVLIGLSFVFKYGAELREGKTDEQNVDR